MCSSDLIGTGRQLHVGSIVTSSNSELLEEIVDGVGSILNVQVCLEADREETYFWMALRIPHMYWSTSRPSNNAVLLKGEKIYVYNNNNLSHSSTVTISL